MAAPRRDCLRSCRAAGIYPTRVSKLAFSALSRRGKTLGRPRNDRATESKAREMLKDGVGMLWIAAELDIGSGTVQRIARETRN
jgi:hypothetical protein